MQETNKNTDCSGETWVEGKAEPISPRVAASLEEPMLGCNIGWTRKGMPFCEVNRSDGTMAPSWRDPDLLPRVANIGWTRRGVPSWEVNRSDGTMAPSSGPITTGGHSTYYGAKCSLGCTSLPRLREPTASLRRGGGEHNLHTVKKSKVDLHSSGRFVVHSGIQEAWFAMTHTNLIH